MRSVPITSTSSSISSSGLKFLVAEEMGECMDAVYARQNSKNNNTELFLCNHKYHDGVGGFTRILEEREGFSYEKMPQIKEKSDLPLLKKVSLLRRFIKLTAKLKTSWLNRKDITGESDGVVLAYLTLEQTQKLKSLAKDSEGSLNSYLFWAVDEISHQEFLTPESERKWVCPVNMRGAFGAQNDYGNVAASIILNFKGVEDPASIRQQTRKYFEENLHVGSWLYTNMARYVGLWGTRKVAKKIKDVGVGVFSNMGAWPQEPSSLNNTDDAQWAVVPPASQVLPVCCACLEWQGKLSLGVQLHPCLGQDINQTYDFVIKVLEKVFFSNDAAQEIQVEKVQLQQLKEHATRIA